jgi:O-antigen ligase
VPRTVFGIDPLLPIRLARRFWRKLTGVLPPAELAALVAAAAVLARVFGWMVRQERRGRSGTVVVAVLALLLFESTMWSSQGDVPAGLFHPSVAGYTFRLYEILIPLALGARLAAHGVPRRVSTTAMVWLAFAVWYAAGAVVGLLAGHDTKEVFFEAKAIAYVVGGYALAAGVPVHEYLGRRGLLRLTIPAALAATVVIALDESNRTLSGGIPGIRLEAFGVMGADTASLLVIVACLTIVLVACQRRRPIGLLTACGPLLASALVAEQRAALLGLAISAGLIALAWLTPTARRRLRTTPTEMGLVALVVAGLLAVPVFFQAAVERRQPALPFAENVAGTFEGPRNEQSAQQRVNQYRAATDVVRQRPVTGWGLGRTITYYATGENVYKRSPIAHNIGADLLIRTGLVGLLLFAAPVATTVAGALRTWRYHPDNLVAAFALACGALVLGLIGKGMVESIFEKYRLAVALGLLLGMARSAATAEPSAVAADAVDLTQDARRWS